MRLVSVVWQQNEMPTPLSSRVCSVCHIMRLGKFICMSLNILKTPWRPSIRNAAIAQLCILFKLYLFRYRNFSFCKMQRRRPQIVKYFDCSKFISLHIAIATRNLSPAWHCSFSAISFQCLQADCVVVICLCSSHAIYLCSSLRAQKVLLMKSPYSSPPQKYSQSFIQS